MDGLLMLVLTAAALAYAYEAPTPRGSGAVRVRPRSALRVRFAVTLRSARGSPKRHVMIPPRRGLSVFTRVQRTPPSKVVWGGQ